MSEEKVKPTYLMVPKRLIVAWLSTSSIIFVMVLASFQYANYVDRKSNSQLCGMVSIFYEATKASTENTAIVQRALIEFGRLLKEYNCT